MITCPKCGTPGWKAIEQGQWLVRVDLIDEDGQIMIEPDPMSEFQQEAVESATVAYTCANELCDFSIEAHAVGELRRAG